MGCKVSKSSKQNAKGEQPQKVEVETRPTNPPIDTQKQEKPASLVAIEQIPSQPNQLSQAEQDPRVPSLKGIASKESPEKNLDSVHNIQAAVIEPTACCYFFGVDGESNKKIFKYDPQTDSFSQLEAPEEMETYNMSSSVYVSETCIYVTGGIDALGSTISNKTYKYNPTANTVETLRPFMFQRYAHQTTFFQGYLYVIGGLSYDKLSDDGMEEMENLLKGVERYDTMTNRWSRVGDLNFGRSLALVMVYQECLYVLGGYIGEVKRSRTIEKLNPETNQWEILAFKLPHGLESSFAFSPAPHKLQIIGGQGPSGCVNVNYVYDFQDHSYQQKRPMNHERVLHKGFVIKGNVIVFGGDNDDTVEEYDAQHDRWTKQPSTFRSLLNIIKLFSCAQPALIIEDQAKASHEEASSPENLRSKKCFVFGDDVNSFICEVNFTKNYVKEHPIPGNLRLYGYQGVAALPDHTYLICGGINKVTNQISSKTYIYNPQTGKAIKVQKSNHARYTFNLISMGGYVYALGGRTWGEDRDALLAQCERFNINTSQWEPIAKMNHARCSAMTFQLRNKLYVLGGYKGDSQRWSNIEVYTPENNTWTTKDISLKVALEGSSLVMANRTGGIFLLGGRTDEGDSDKIWDFNVDQGDMWEIGNLKERKSLTKIFEFNERKVFILGGEQYMAELFDLTELKPIETNKFANEISENLSRIVERGRKVDNKLLRFSLA